MGSVKDRIIEIRKCEKLSQTKFAESLGVSRGVIANLERGLTELKPPFSGLICEKYHINKKWLETGIGEKYDVIRSSNKSEMNARMRLVRETLNMSQVKFGEVAGISVGVIKNIDYNKTEPNPLFFDLLCEAHGINKKWIETGDGEMFRTPSVDEEIAEFVGTALNGNSDPFKRRVLLALSRMDEAGWQKAKEFLLMLKEEEERENNE